MPYSTSNPRLADVCQINTGLTVRGKLDPAEHGFRVAQMRDVSPGADLDIELLASFDLDLPLVEHTLVL